MQVTLQPHCVRRAFQPDLLSIVRLESLTYILRQAAGQLPMKQQNPQIVRAIAYIPILSPCLLLLGMLTCLLPPTPAVAADVGKPFTITIVDEQTGRGVPLVELQTVNAVRYFTDSNGIVAFYEPGLMDQIVFFHIKSHGYEFTKDGFGYGGTRFPVTKGGSIRLKIKRINVAERLYRVTGAGIYRDSILAGQPVPTRQPLLNGLVFGQDSVLNAVYRGKVYWFWGDTSWPRYPLGNFHCPGATSLLPKDGGLDPEVGVDLEYFLDERGFAKETAKLPGHGPTWLDGLTVLADDSGKQRLFARYVKVAKPMKVYETGLVEFNDEKKQFENRMPFDLDVPLKPSGHPFKHVSDGTEYVHFPLLTRVRARVQDYLDLSKYETFTCFRQGCRADAIELDRAADGRLRYAWKTDTAPLTAELQRKLIAKGRMKPEEGWFHVTDIETGESVTIHRVSIYWNEYRKRWVMIMCQGFGRSMIGEIWYVEADTPVGPWVYARRIVTHDKYSFYNPKQHPMFDKHGGRVIFFEGTYTHTFSGNPDRTPWYDYNQILYKLDLSDPRVILPVPVYRLSDGDVPNRFGTSGRLNSPRSERPIAFFALDRKKPGAIAVFEKQIGAGHTVLQTSTVASSLSDAGNGPLFFALPPDTDPPPPATVPLYEFVHEDGLQRAYSTGEACKIPNYRRVERPLCLVWRDFWTAAIHRRFSTGGVCFLQP